jgi:glutathione S-transferase
MPLPSGFSPDPGISTTAIRLLYSDISPFARKTRIVALERGLADLLFESVDPLGDDTASLWQLNPLGKIPVLVTDKGEVIVDSRNICEFLDGLGSMAPLIPSASGRRREVLTRQAIGDGLSELAVDVRMELRRPEAERSPAWIARWSAAVTRTISTIPAPDIRDDLDLGDIAIAVALTFVRHRLPQIEWTAGRADLHAWLERLAQRNSFRATDFSAGSDRQTRKGQE